MMTHLQHFMAILKMTGTTWLSSFQRIIQPQIHFMSQHDACGDRFSWVTWCIRLILAEYKYNMYMGCLCVLGI